MNPLQAQFGRFRIDEAEARLEREGGAIDVPPRAFQVLCELIRRAGQLVTKDALLDAVWGHRHVNEAALKNIVSQVRQALGDDAREPVYIQTVARHGYRFIAALGEQKLPEQAPAQAQASNVATTQLNGLVGRTNVLAKLQRALALARLGRRQQVFVTGEAGIGKSSLVEKFAAIADVPVAFGQCIEHYGGAEPYMPILEALDSLCKSDRGDLVIVLMRGVAPTWLLQLPWFVRDNDRRDFQSEAAGATQDRMLREFGELVDRLTDAQPLLLVLEDLQWSDSATIQLLGYLARRRRDCALMLLGTFRPTELILHEHPLAGLLQEMKPRNQCVEIDLEYFAETELGEFLSGRLGSAPTEEFVRALHTHTLGLPLFVTAVLEDLLASGKISKDGYGWNYPDPQALTIPSNISGLIERQVLRLPVEQQRVLGAASVCGMHFLHLALVDVVRIAPESLQQLLEDAAVRLPWLRCEGVSSVADGRVSARYAFAHTLYRQTIYDHLPTLQRVEYHRLWAKALAQLHGSAPAEVAAELALHFERGGEPVQAAIQLAIVASRAMACGAPREALSAARHGLRLAANLMEPALELELRSIEAVALTREHAMSSPEVAAAFARARAIGPVDGSAWRRTLQGCWWVHFTLAQYDQALELAREILDQAEQRKDSALHLTGLNAMGIVLAITGDFVAARSHLEHALDAHAQLSASLASTSFVQDPVVEAELALIFVYWLGGEPMKARALAERAVAIAVRHQHPTSEAAALYSASVAHALAGEFDTVYALTERLNSLVREHALPERRSGFAWLHGQSLVALGRVDEGLDEMRVAAQNARELRLRTGLGGFYYHYAQACRMAGRLRDIEASVQAGLDFVEEVKERSLLAPLLGLQAEIEMSRGETGTAAATWKHAVSIARTQGAIFHELVLQAAAIESGWAVAEPDRLRILLSHYDQDPSPVVVRARALAERTT